jgi:hypothetical protein
MFYDQRRAPFVPEGRTRLRVSRIALPMLMSGFAFVSGCSFNEIIERPDYADNALYSLCDYGQPLTVKNRGIYDSRSGSGDLLLAGQLSNQPVESFLNFQSLRLEYLPNTGLHVTLVSLGGVEQSELIPATWIRCADDAMELDLPSDAFYVWASVGVKTRRLRLQVARDDSLILHNVWEEKGMGAIVIPLKFSGDSWATFPLDDSITFETPPQVAATFIGECDGLIGDFSVNGTAVRLDGSMENRSAEAQFFRPEIMGEPAQPDGPAAVALRITHAAEGGIDLAMLRQDGTPSIRRLEATRVFCTQGRWIVKGKKDVMSPFMLLVGSGGVSWEDLALWRDSDGALMVRGTYRSRGAIFLIPAGSTSELFMRFELVLDPKEDDGRNDDSI